MIYLVLYRITTLRRQNNIFFLCKGTGLNLRIRRKMPHAKQVSPCNPHRRGRRSDILRLGLHTRDTPGLEKQMWTPPVLLRPHTQLKMDSRPGSEHLLMHTSEVLYTVSLTCFIRHSATNGQFTQVRFSTLCYKFWRHCIKWQIIDSKDNSIFCNVLLLA